MRGGEGKRERVGEGERVGERERVGNDRAGERRERSVRAGERREGNAREHSTDRSREHFTDRSRERNTNHSRERNTNRYRDHARSYAIHKHDHSSSRFNSHQRNYTSTSASRSHSIHSCSREQLAEDTRDARTIFVTHLPQWFTDQDLYDFFVKAGRIHSAKIVTDKLTQKSKGIAYIEFTSEEAALNALQTLNGQRIDGNSITVQRSEISKTSNVEQQQQQLLKSASLEKVHLPQDKVLVRNIYLGIGEDSLRRVFEVVGRISCLVFASDTEISGTSMAIVQFEREEEAKQASEELNSFVLGGIPLEVKLLAERSAAEAEGCSFDEFYNESESTRSKLMRRLLREQSALGPPSSFNSRSCSSCIQLSGVYDPEQEQSQYWEHEIADDIRSECSKIGKVSHLAVQKNKSGDVFVKFSEAKAAQKAIEVFNGRWFGMRQIGCRYIPENIYNDMFFP